jgi:beta-glucosidase
LTKQTKPLRGGVNFLNMTKLSIILSWLLIACLWACQPPKTTQVPAVSGQLPYKNPSLAVEQRARDLLARMTLAEKTAQLQCRWNSARTMMDQQGNFLPDSAAKYMPHGIGQIVRPKEAFSGVGNFPSRTTENTVQYCNAVQRYLRDKTRLGIPAIMHEEALHGYVAREATAFPQAIGLASTWNTALLQQVFDIAAREARSAGNHLVLAPVVDIVRDPRWGRTEETFGEDPFLAGAIGLAAVKGLQGENGRIDSLHVMATLKHMTGHGQPEGGNNVGPAPTPMRMVQEYFLPPFKRCIEEGHAWNVMASYNEIDGVPSHNSNWLLQDILRQQWGFRGVVVSDYYGIAELHRRHRVATDLKDAAKKAIASGVDVETPDPDCYVFLNNIFAQRELPIAVLDSAVIRVLRQKIALGLFETPFASEEVALRTVGAAAHIPTALQAAEEAIVLLKNEGALAPVSTDRYKTIAVIGPNANRTLLGGYSDEPRYFVTVLEGIKQKVGRRAQVTYAEGCGITEPCSWYKDPVTRTDPATDRQKIADAVQLARSADLVILALGGNECESREAWAESHLGDQATMNLQGMQDSLVNAIVASGKPVICLLLNGRPYSIVNIAQKVPAIFECWYLGQETGHAIANTLFGDNNPSGRLPISFPRSVGHLPVFYNHKPTARRGYAFDEVTPLFAFGEGLSYTTFEYGPPRLQYDTLPDNGSQVVKVSVRNTGKVAGKTVVQCYVRDVFGSVTRPVKELKEFRKISLQPGESQELMFVLSPNSLQMLNDKMEWVVEPGEFEVMTGSSSKDIDLKKASFFVKKRQKK